jgi:hypothetical protein
MGRIHHDLLLIITQELACQRAPATARWDLYTLTFTNENNREETRRHGEVRLPNELIHHIGQFVTAENNQDIQTEQNTREQENKAILSQCPKTVGE